MGTVMEKNKKEVSKKVVAKLRYIRVSPFKLRKVADVVRTMPIDRALQYLKLMNQKSSNILLQLFNSCIANASHNFSISSDSLLMYRLTVNEAGRIKRNKIRARGRVFSITKPMSHVDLVLVEKGKEV